MKLALNEKIIIYRLRKGWTQAQLGKQAGIHRVTIQRVERRGTRDIGTIEKIAKALGVTMEDLRSD